ncbi:MAG: bifunctional riboflavin kinase/FAD synthetase [Candidatus Acidiferrales bacterium]
MPLEVMHSSEEWRMRLGNTRPRTAVTVGNFDGVHLGHQKILRGVADRAREMRLMSAALTFYPHPARVLRPEQAPSLLATLPQRLAAFDALGIEAAMVLQFDAALAKITAEDFVRRFLVEAMCARVVLVGANFRFGHGGAGDVKLLTKIGKDRGFEVESVDPVLIGAMLVSSTAIRQALQEGRVADARQMLGRPFALAGAIQPGTGQGRKLVVPTLNLATFQETLPKKGVYATEAAAGGKIYRAVTNVGLRPTFHGAKLTIESHLFDFAETLTEGPLEVRFWERLRDEKKFAGPEELRAQVLNDIETAKKDFARTAGVPSPK